MIVGNKEIKYSEWEQIFLWFIINIKIWNLKKQCNFNHHEVSVGNFSSFQTWKETSKNGNTFVEFSGCFGVSVGGEGSEEKEW